jgi:hypothetical protein
VTTCKATRLPDRARWLTASVLLAFSCAGGAAHAPNATRPIEETRAVHVIAASVRSAGERPLAGGTVLLASGRSIHVDVAVERHRYGVAYLTAGDLASMVPSEDLPPHMPDGDLPIVQGSGPDHDAVVLVLFADDYLQDDLAGDRHEMTTITAENKIHRDVRDFLTQARARKLR